MHKPVISSKIMLVAVIVMSMLLTSCVAKKKYIAMQESKNRAEQRVRVLTKDVENLESEFNGYKNDFHASNEEKDMMIDSLTLRINEMNAALLSKDENIDERVFSFQVEKRRLNEMLTSKDKEIRTLRSRVQSLETQVENLKSDMQDSGIKLQNALSRQKNLEFEIEQKEEQLDEMKALLSKKNDEAARLQNTIAEKDAELDKLRNQVKLLRQEYGQN
ncbi:MAG TPA: hypothetical protein VJ909_09265 [Prolixibacteraceae bacterium]|nr:hypothetical protein [Prolixibacteraceae bacterium]